MPRISADNVDVLSMNTKTIPFFLNVDRCQNATVAASNSSVKMSSVSSHSGGGCLYSCQGGDVSTMAITVPISAVDSFGASE